MSRHQVSSSITAIAAIAGLLSLGMASVCMSASEEAQVGQAGGPPPETREHPGESGADASMQEIVVTARKRDERLIDIPESITFLSANELAARGIESVEDVGRQTPNLQLNMRQDMTTDVVIRGVGAYGDVLGVGFVIDNVPNFTDQTMPIDDLESIEILKGPQGTLYGGSSIGGIVRYVAKKPDFSWDGQASGEAGSFSEMSLRAAQNITLVDGILALRVSGYDFKNNGWFTNSALNITPDPTTSYGMRAALLFKPKDGLEALLTLRHAYMQNGSDMYVGITGPNAYTFDAPFFQATYNTRTVNGGVLEINDDLGIGKLTSITSYTSAQYSIDADISQSPPNIPGQTLYTLPGERPATVGTQELRIASASDSRVDWLFGLYGAVIRNILLNDLAIASYPPPLDPFVLNQFETKRTDLAAFGSAAFHIGPFRLETGARFSHTLFHTFIDIEAGGPPNQSVSVTSQSVLPKVSLSYPLAGNGQVYATMAKGEEPGAVNVVSVAPVPYRSETALSREIGIKTQTSDRKLSFDAAAFYVTNNDHQVQTNLFSPGLGLITVTSNIGDSRTYGVETSANWRPTEALNFGLEGGYLNAQWTKAAAFGITLDGKDIPNAPRFTSTASVGYTVPAFQNLELESRFDTSYTDAMWWDLPNAPGKNERPHFLSNLRFALGPDDHKWQVVLRATNIFNRSYWTEFLPNFFLPGSLPCAGCTDYGAIGAPRQIFGSVSYRW